MKKKKNGTKKERAKWGRKGGRIGGKRRALALSPERRREIAAAGARAMWARRRTAEEQNRALQQAKRTVDAMAAVNSSVPRGTRT